MGVGGGGRGTPTGSGIVPGDAIQRNTGCQVLPSNCGRCGGSSAAWLLLGGAGGTSGPKARLFILDSRPISAWPLLTNQPFPQPPLQLLEVSCTTPTLWSPPCPDGVPFLGTFLLSLAQMAPPPGSLPSLPPFPPACGSDAHCCLTQRLGDFPPHSPDIFLSPPSDRV